MRSLRLVLSTLAVLLLAPGIAGANWSQPGYSAANLRSSPIDSALSAANIGQIEGRWAWQAPDGNDEAEQAVGPALVADGLVFVVVESQRIVARHAATGAPAWEADLGEGSGAQLAAHGRTLYAASGNQLLSFPARCRTDGGTCVPRVMATGESRLTTPAVTATRVLVVDRAGDSDERLLAFDRACLKACAPLWRFRYRGAQLSDPSAGNGRAWVGTTGGSLLGFPLDCTPSATGVCAIERRAAVAGKSLAGAAPSVATSRIYTKAGDGVLYAFPSTCTTACGPAWRSVHAGYGRPAVTGSRVWASRNPGNNSEMVVDGYSTVCAPAAGKCSPASSIDVSEDEPEGPTTVKEQITVADGLIFVPIAAMLNEPGGTKVYSTSCAGPDCPLLARLGNLLPQGPATVANGTVYLVEQVQEFGGTDPGPFFSYVKAFALPEED